MKRIFSVFLVLAVALVCFAACDTAKGECAHQWEEATCTTLKTCAKCGKTEGKVLDHIALAYEVTVEATCSTDGVKKGLCAICGAELTERIAATGEHKIDQWTETAKATCAEEGSREGKCTSCEQTFTEKIEKLDHSDDNTWVVVKTPSAYASGKRATHCRACGCELQTETFDLSLEEKNAIKQAESYLDFMAFSRKGLIDQLEFEGYSTKVATAAVDSIAVDWNEQAVKKAESYLELMSFSKKGLIDQLVFEGFTKEQANYAAAAVGY